MAQRRKWKTIIDWNEEVWVGLCVKPPMGMLLLTFVYEYSCTRFPHVSTPNNTVRQVTVIIFSETNNLPLILYLPCSNWWSWLLNWTQSSVYATIPCSFSSLDTFHSCFLRLPSSALLQSRNSSTAKQIFLDVPEQTLPVMLPNLGLPTGYGLKTYKNLGLTTVRKAWICIMFSFNVDSWDVYVLPRGSLDNKLWL